MCSFAAVHTLDLPPLEGWTKLGLQPQLLQGRGRRTRSLVQSCLRGNFKVILSYMRPYVRKQTNEQLNTNQQMDQVSYAYGYNDMYGWGSQGKVSFPLV